MAQGGLMEASDDLVASNTCWLVLTPSVDHGAWTSGIHAAAERAGWLIIPEHEAGSPSDGPQRLVITEDARHALEAGAGKIAAIVAEPETSFAAVAEMHGLAALESCWHASMLLARALSLAPGHRVVTAAELATQPQEILLFDALRLTPPESRAEFAKDPLIANAFRLYRDVADHHDGAIMWSEKLFNYCPRASRNSSSMGLLDTTGRPRMLVHGPYLAMPAGRWRANIRFGVDRDAAKRQYRLDWGTRTATFSEHVTPRAPGIYELSLDFDWAEADAAEIRLILMEGSFDGTLIFEGVTVERIL